MSFFKNKKMMMIMSMATIVVALSVFIYINNKATPVIELVGQESLIIEAGSAYEDPGAIAYLKDEDITSQIVKRGSVDSSKLGKYTIDYAVLNSDGKERAKKSRNVEVVDTTEPDIKLIGSSSITIYVGSTYQELGYEVLDNCDQDLSKEVSIEGEVDTNVVGKYTLTYRVKDISNNETNIQRNIEVIPKPITKTEHGIPVLMYHFFYDKTQPLYETDNNFTEISAFEEQMKYLVDQNYYFPTWEEILQYMDGHITLPQKSIVITIDDGAQSFFELAVPVLNKYGIRATSFVVSSWTDRNYIAPYQSNLLSFHSHTYNMHTGQMPSGGWCQQGGIILCVDYQMGVEDLNKSKEETGGSYVFCYPFGHYNDHALKMLSDTGFKLAFTTQSGKIKPGMNKLLLPRVRISKGISLNQFINTIK